MAVQRDCDDKNSTIICVYNNLTLRKWALKKIDVRNVLEKVI